MAHTEPAYVAHTEPAYVAHTEPFSIFNVMDYGAHADGETDDAAHVQAAVDAAHAAGGGTVYMPAGTYYLACAVGVNPWALGGTCNEHGVSSANADMQCSVNVLSGVHIQGAGNTQTFVTTDEEASVCFGAYNQTNIGVSDLDGTMSVPELISGVLKFMYCHNLTLENLIIHGTHTGMSMLGCHDSVMQHNYVYDIVDSGYTIQGVCPAGPVPQVTDNVRLIDCECGPSPVAGTGTGFRITGWPPGYANVARVNNVSLTDCYAHDVQSAFRIMYASNITGLRCVAESSPHFASRDLCLINVATAHFTTCHAAYLVTEANQNAWWVAQGSEDCTNITED